ncbi:hypothetical protein HanXRQr2_Chr09g0415841 [Helianthus annuus]|uniref:Uncharacterized protein n=1 Tax=Helianthus annuus TaxID=4232 RepID=A0A9K3NAR7_HELAN|nr:hypothetical protein HanXRQr2_Chr09g0415841 [Helianthus annuus]
MVDLIFCEFFLYLWCFLLVVKRESGYTGVLLQLNSYSSVGGGGKVKLGEWCEPRLKAEADQWLWWCIRFLKTFLVILLRFIIKLRSSSNFLLDMFFLIM